MAVTLKSVIQRTPANREILWIQSFTVAWMCIECSTSLLAARQARSAALLAFGSDSSVELLSAVVVLLQFLPGFPLSEKRATRFAAILLFTLCGVVFLSSAIALSYRIPAESSLLGITVTALALLVMPVIAQIKRRKARETRNHALAADAVQSATCAYLAALTLISLAVNALFHIRWFDSLGALLAIPILVVEGRRAWRGQGCGCV